MLDDSAQGWVVINFRFAVDHVTDMIRQYQAASAGRSGNFQMYGGQGPPDMSDFNAYIFDVLWTFDWIMPDEVTSQQKVVACWNAYTVATSLIENYPGRSLFEQAYYHACEHVRFGGICTKDTPWLDAFKKHNLDPPTGTIAGRVQLFITGEQDCVYPEDWLMVGPPKTRTGYTIQRDDRSNTRWETCVEPLNPTHIFPTKGSLREYEHVIDVIDLQQWNEDVQKPFPLLPVAEGNRMWQQGTIIATVLVIQALAHAESCDISWIDPGVVAGILKPAEDDAQNMYLLEEKFADKYMGQPGWANVVAARAIQALCLLETEDQIPQHLDEETGNLLFNCYDKSQSDFTYGLKMVMRLCVAKSLSFTRPNEWAHVVLTSGPIG